MSLKTWKVLLHCLLEFILAEKNSGVNLFLFSFYIAWCKKKKLMQQSHKSGSESKLESF
jgi:hypothetical protein